MFNLNFGQAVEALKSGKTVAREGWNGKGMFLFLLPAANVPVIAIHDPVLRAVIERELGSDTFEALGTIRMFTADKKILTGWLASQTDILSEDWGIVWQIICFLISLLYSFEADFGSVEVQPNRNKRFRRNNRYKTIRPNESATLGLLY